MKKNVQILFKTHKTLIVCSLISILLLVVFIIFQYFQFSGLNLDIKWLIVSGIPIIIGLFIGEYIKSFKGFGIEIEASLKAELPKDLISPIPESIIVESSGFDKESLISLQEMNEKERDKISRLRFVTNRRNYYDSKMVLEYFKQLRNLKYVEVVNNENKFQYLIPINHFKKYADTSLDKIIDFISQIECKSHFSNAITAYVNYDDSLLDAYQRLLSKVRKIEILGDKKLPVLDSNNKLIGLISKTKVEEFICKEVLGNYNKNGD